MRKLTLKPDVSGRQILRYHFRKASNCVNNINDGNNVDAEYTIPGECVITITKIKQITRYVLMCTYTCERSKLGTSHFICAITLRNIDGKIDPQFDILDYTTMEVVTRFRGSEVVGDPEDIIAPDNKYCVPTCSYCNSTIQSVLWLDYKIVDNGRYIMDVNANVEYTSIDKDPNTYGYDLTPIYKACVNPEKPNETYVLASLLPVMQSDDHLTDIMDFITHGRNKGDDKYTRSPIPGPYCRGCGKPIRYYTR